MCVCVCAHNIASYFGPAGQSVVVGRSDVFVRLGACPSAVQTSLQLDLSRRRSWDEPQPKHSLAECQEGRRGRETCRALMEDEAISEQRI